MFPIISGATAAAPESWKNTQGIIGFQWTPTNNTNIVNSSGVIAGDVSTAGVQARGYVTGCEWGGDKGMFFGGYYGVWASWGGSNIVSNTGVIATDVAEVANARGQSPGVHFGTDQGLIGFSGASNTITNLVSNTGVIASDVAIGAGITSRSSDDNACEYGGDKAIFGFGSSPSYTMTNLISNTGVVGTDVAAVVGVSYRDGSGGVDWGEDSGIFAYGGLPNVSNIVSNLGIVATDVAGVGTARPTGGCAEYGTDKGIWAFGGGDLTTTNRVSNTGVIAGDGQAAGSGKNSCGGCSFGV